MDDYRLEAIIDYNDERRSMSKIERELEHYTALHTLQNADIEELALWPDGKVTLVGKGDHGYTPIYKADILRLASPPPPEPMNQGDGAYYYCFRCEKYVFEGAHTCKPASPPAPPPERPMSQSIEELIGDLEGSAISENNACPECSHPSCERRRNSLTAARSALLAAYRELEADKERMDWLAVNYEGADFRYGDTDNPICIIAIRIPENGRVSADLRHSVDALLRSSSPAHPEIKA